MSKSRVEWAVRVDVEHPKRSEKAGDIITHFGDEKSQHAKEIWEGWTPVYRLVTEWREQKPEVVRKRDQGTCSVCGRPKSLNRRGMVFSHESPRGRGERWAGQCPGSRKPPVDGSVRRAESESAA